MGSRGRGSWRSLAPAPVRRVDPPHCDRRSFDICRIQGRIAQKIAHEQHVADILVTNLHTMDRRTAISRIGVMLGGALSASTMSALISGCSTPAEEGYAPLFLSSDQLERIARLSEAIIPETDTPGARAAGVHRFIDTLLDEYYPRPEAEAIRSKLDDFVASHRIDALSDEALIKQLSEVDRLWAEGEANPVWASIKEWTIAGYYTSEIGMTQELRMMPFTEARMDMPRSDIERTWA